MNIRTDKAEARMCLACQRWFVPDDARRKTCSSHCRRLLASDTATMRERERGGINKCHEPTQADIAAMCLEIRKNKNELW